jgi:hypothetical protein
MRRLTADSYERGELGKKGRIKEPSQEISRGKLASRFLPQLAHHVDLGIDGRSRYRRVSGPRCDTGRTPAHEA